MFTKTMFCLAKHQPKVPTTAEKLSLIENRLGEKRISFPTSATDTAVKNMLFGYVQVVYCQYLTKLYGYLSNIILALVTYF